MVALAGQWWPMVANGGPGGPGWPGGLWWHAYVSMCARANTASRLILLAVFVRSVVVVVLRFYYES